jgi:two-component system, NtrC family, sensor kinase
MTVRVRLMIVTMLGLAVTMAVWGWIQLRALEGILIDQQLKRLYDVAETVNTYYQHFPTVYGLSVLDIALKDHVQSDGRLARIDIFSTMKEDVDYIAGAGRVPYDWTESLVASAGKKGKPFHMKITTEDGPALGLLHPAGWGEKPGRRVVVSVIVFSRSNAEILSRAQYLLVLSSSGLLIAILLILAFSYGWLIERPLKVITDTIDEFQAGSYARRIPILRKDEWGRLADHFNKMAGEIEQVLDRNRELNRQLEERVQEATHNVVQLQKQVNQLQQLTALGYLTATLAHDLGTPLHSIAGLSRLLMEREEGWPPDVARKLELIVQQTERLNTVIQNVRRATRLPEPHFEALSISDLFSDTLSLVEPQLQRADIKVSVNTEADVPPLYADRDRIQTAMFNLIQNCIEAMPEGGMITVSAYTVPSRRSIALSVRDTGCGISPELMERVCEPFFSTHKDEGMRGLGLSIVHDIVKAHGGQMEIKSRPEDGSEIILYFPLVDVLPAEDAG